MRADERSMMQRGRKECPFCGKPFAAVTSDGHELYDVHVRGCERKEQERLDKEWEGLAQLREALKPARIPL